MQQLIISLGIVLVCVALAACSTTKSTPTDHSGQQITFGDGGGFAGIEHTYVLLDNGALYKKADNGQHDFVHSVDKQLAKQVFVNAVELDLGNYLYLNPGNMYEYIEWDNDGQTNRICWDSYKDNVKKEIKILHQILKNTLQHAE